MPVHNKGANVSDMTRMLCGICIRAERIKEKGEDPNFLIEDDSELLGWWNVHKEACAEDVDEERRRLQGEKLKIEALRKLTIRERWILGVK